MMKCEMWNMKRALPSLALIASLALFAPAAHAQQNSDIDAV